MISPRLFILLIVLSASLLSACSSGGEALLDETKSINGEGWDVNEPISLNVDVSDTINSYAFYLNLRNTEDYPYRNIFILINTTLPDGYTAVDTFAYDLADKEGKWFGSSSGGIIDNQVRFISSRKFPVAGNYTFELSHAMREEILYGVTDVGLRIEKTK